MIISAKFQVSILKTVPVMLRRNTAIHKYINTHGSISSQNGMKTEESLFLRSFLLRKKENSLFEGNLYERNKRFLIMSTAETREKCRSYSRVK